jgi:hypothetical protein
MLSLVAASCQLIYYLPLQVVVVWDALGGATSVTTRERIHGIDVVFCGNTDADFFLIQEVTIVPLKTPMFNCPNCTSS